MGGVKNKLIDEEESRDQVLREKSVDIPLDEINTVIEWIDSTLQDGEGVNELFERDLISGHDALLQIRRYL